jgi:hypothetical protein
MAGAKYYFPPFPAVPANECSNPAPGSNISFGERITRTIIVADLPEDDIRCNGASGSCSIPYGGTATIEWCGSGGSRHACTGATSCIATGTVGAGDPPDTLTSNWTSPSLIANATYTLDCSGLGGSISKDVNVNVGVAPLPETDLRCNNSAGSCNIDFGDSAILEWCGADAHSCANATSCSVSGPGVSTSGFSGTVPTPLLFADSRYDLDCFGPGGSRNDFVNVNMNSIPECSDGLDNDGDGNCDTSSSICTDGSTPGDISCTGPFDDDETNPECSDNIDNDGDGRIDFDGSPPDLGCTSLFDNNESDPTFNEF